MDRQHRNLEWTYFNQGSSLVRLLPGITCPKIAAIDEEEHSHLAQELWQESTRYEPVGKPGSGLVAGTLGSIGGQRIHLEVGKLRHGMLLIAAGWIAGHLI